MSQSQLSPDLQDGGLYYLMESGRRVNLWELEQVVRARVDEAKYQALANPMAPNFFDIKWFYENRGIKSCDTLLGLSGHVVLFMPNKPLE